MKRVVWCTSLVCCLEFGGCSLFESTKQNCNRNSGWYIDCCPLGHSKLYSGFWSRPFQDNKAGGRVYSLCHYCAMIIPLTKTVKRSHGFAELCTDSASRLITKNIAGVIIASGLKKRSHRRASDASARAYDVRIMTKNAFSEKLCGRGTRNRDASWSGLISR